MGGTSKRMFKVLTEKLLLLKSVNIFKCMEIAKTVYEGVVESSHNKTTTSHTNRAGHSRKIRGVTDYSKTYSEKGNHAVKFKQRYVDHPRDRSKLTCLIHVPGHS